MNYIKQLQQDLAGKKAFETSIRRSFMDFWRYLHSPKFTGFEGNGERKDWIATSDVLKWLQETESEAVNASNNAKRQTINEREQ